MTHSLDDALSELNDCCDDFENAGYRSAENVLVRLLECIDRQPIASLQAALLPAVEFRVWWEECQSTKGGMVGSGRLNWPTDRASRVSMQFQLCRAIVRKEVDLLDVAREFCYSGSSRFDDNLREFSVRVLRPCLRDLGRLGALRLGPPVLCESLAMSVPATGDATLDDLIRRARDGFQDKNPAVRRDALEKLWDAWERLKTVERAGDKRLSLTLLLDRAAQEPEFRKVLEGEARALTSIGNQFHIRHFETDKVPIGSDAQVDFFFHRLWAMMWLVLGARERET